MANRRKNIFCRNCGEFTVHEIRRGCSAYDIDPVYVCRVCGCEVSKAILKRFGVKADRL